MFVLNYCQANICHTVKWIYASQYSMEESVIKLNISNIEVVYLALSTVEHYFFLGYQMEML